MGIAKNQKHEARGKTSNRGSVNNSARLAAFNQRAGTGSADWGGCRAEVLQEVVTAITNLGGACTFGLSRDHGAHSLTLMLDNERTTLWFNGGADLDDELAQVMETLAE